jgi:ABC-type branched-subunit amino acid transport system substrate-binding protein
LSEDAGAVVKALRARLGPDVALLATEAMLPVPELLGVSGRAATGMYFATAAMAHEGLTPAGRRFLREFAATQPGGVVPSAVYIAEAAQAAEALLEAIARSDGTRASVLGELRRLRVEDGILGDFRFDSNGDMTPTPFSIFRVNAQGAVEGGGNDPFAGSVFDRVVRVPAELVGP